MSKLSVASSVLKLHRFIMEQEKVEHFLQKPDFRDPFFKYNDCRNWVSILSDKKVIRVAELSAIQSKPTSEEANIYLHTLLLRDPSFDKLRILSQALGEDETHRNQKKLSDTIVNFLETENAELLKSTGRPADRPASVDIPMEYLVDESCFIRLQCTLMGSSRIPAKDVMRSLYFSTYCIIKELLKGHTEKVKQQAILSVDQERIPNRTRQNDDIMAAKSTEEVLKYFDIPNKWDDPLPLVDIILAVLSDRHCYEKAMKVLSHYKEHLLQYKQALSALKNKKAIKGASKPLGKDQLEVNITIEDSIDQLRYSTCNDLLVAVLTEGAGIPRDSIEYGKPVRLSSSIITYYIPNLFAKSLMEAVCKGTIVWAMLELRVKRIEIPRYCHFEINWSTAVFSIKNSLLSNEDFFSNTKRVSKTFQAAVDLMLPLSRRKNLKDPQRKFHPQLWSESFPDMLVFCAAELRAMKPKLISGEDKETLDTKLREKEEDIKNLAVEVVALRKENDSLNVQLSDKESYFESQKKRAGAINVQLESEVMAVETKLKERDYQIKILKEDKQMYMDQVLSLRKQGHMTTELEEKTETKESIIESYKSEMVRLADELAKRDQIIEDFKRSKECFTKELALRICKNKEDILKATEELIIAEHQLEKLNMQPVACLQKQKRRFKNYSWPFLDKELVKQDLDSHAENVKSIEKQYEKLIGNIIFLEGECISIATAISCLGCDVDKIFEVINGLVKEGLVPEWVKEEIELEKQEYFWPHLTRNKSKALLESQSTPKGSFLICRSESVLGRYVLHVKLTDEYSHGLSEKSDISFGTVKELVQYYKKNPMTGLFPRINVKLDKLIPKPKVDQSMRPRAKAVSSEDKEAKHAVQETLQEKLETKDLIIEVCKSEMVRLTDELAKRDQITEDFKRSHNPAESCAKELTLFVCKKKEDILKATEELIVAEHLLEKLNMQLFSDQQKQNRQSKHYSWSFLDKELQKQNLDKLAENVKSIEKQIEKLKGNIIFLEDECISIATAINCLGCDEDKIFEEIDGLVKEGLVPEKIKEEFELEKQEYFWPHLNRNGSQVLLDSKSIPKGSFLIRKSESALGRYVLHVKLGDEYSHKGSLIIKLENGRYSLSEKSEVSFATVKEFVQYYKRNPMTELFPRKKMKLDKAIPKPSKLLPPIYVLRNRMMESEKKKIDLLKGEGDIKHITYVNAPKTFSEAINLPEKPQPLTIKLLTDFIPGMAPDWDMLGCKLGMETTVAKLRGSEKDADKKCLQMLQEWLNHSDASWRVLLEALFKIGQQVLACQLAELAEKLNEKS